MCPICKRKVFAHDERPGPDSESDSEVDDTVPLLYPTNSQTSRNGGTFVVQRENPFQRARRTFLERQQQQQTAPVVTRPQSQSSSETDYNRQSDDNISENSILNQSTSQSISSDAADVEHREQRSSFKALFNRIHELFSSSNSATSTSNDDNQFATSSAHNSINNDNISDHHADNDNSPTTYATIVEI